MKDPQKSDFHNHIEEAKEAQARLNDLYRNTIGLIDSLKNRSKKYMNQVSYIEDGLAGEKPNVETMEQNIEALANDISEFNRVIRQTINNFGVEIEKIIENYSAICKLYQGDKGELSMLLNGRKRLLFLDIMIRKFRSKINSLQQMNNILFSFSKELKKTKEEYRQNLILVNSELANSLEYCTTILREIESLN